MRKIILVVLCIIVFISCLTIVSFGFHIGNHRILGYKALKTANDEKNQMISNLNEKNDNEFEQKFEELNAVVNDYTSIKADYDKLVENGSITDRTIYSSVDLYNMNYLWTTIGNYATECNVTLQLDVSRSSTSAAISSEYVMCDLNFTVSGEYIAITDFIDKIEKDDNLGFEITKFSMEKGGENLQATFVVKNVPINSQTLSAIPTV